MTTAADPKAVLPADYTCSSTDAGVRRFSVTFKTAGTQALRTRDTLTATITGLHSGIVVR